MTGVQTALVVVIGIACSLLGAGLGFWAGTSWGISWTMASVIAASKSVMEEKNNDENS